MTSWIVMKSRLISSKELSMIALSLVDIKDFMNKLLCTDLFDHFLLSEATINTFASYTIDGHLNPDFYSPEDEAYEILAQTAIARISALPGKSAAYSGTFRLCLFARRHHRHVSESQVSGSEADLHHRNFLPHLHDGQVPGAGMGSAHHRVSAESPDSLRGIVAICCVKVLQIFQI